MRLQTEKALDDKVASRIRTLRNAAGLSQSVLAEGLGVTFQQIQKIEGGKNRAGAGRLVIIADMLGVRVADLFKDIDKPKATDKAMVKDIDAMNAFLGSRHGQALIKAIMNMTNAERIALLDVATAMAERERKPK